MPRLIEDLSALARRGSLSQAESRRLDMYLKSSAEARELHEIGLGYDRMQTDRPGDDALLRRLSERALALHARQPPAKRRGRAGRSVAWFAAGALLASMAGASAWRYRYWEPSKTLMVPAASVSAPMISRSPSTTAAPHPALDASEPLPAVPSTSSPPTVSRSTGRAGSVGAGAGALPARGFEDAQTLFSRANAERKSGDLPRALASYEALRQAYPASPEARLSVVLSARLELRSGDAARSLSHFERYLALEPNGALAEEALQGKAQALRLLGRAAEERQAWRLLLERFPKSVQAQTARTRLTQEP